MINRLGSSLSATGAALVIYQAIIEAKFEKTQIGDAIALRSLSPINREMAERIIIDRIEKRRAKRIEIVAAIALIVCVGEIMHGWGNYLYISSLWDRLYIFSYYGSRH